MNYIEKRGLDIRAFSKGKPSFIAALVDALDIPQLFSDSYETHREVGCRVKNRLGSVDELFFINVCDDHHPLCRMQEYFEDKDVPQLAGTDVEWGDLTDDHVAALLDHLYQWGPRSIFTAIATQAFFKYGLSIHPL